MLDQRTVEVSCAIAPRVRLDELEVAAPRILLLDSDARLCAELAELLQASGYCAATGAWSEHAVTALTSDAFDLIVLNLESSELHPAQILQAIRQAQRDVPLIVTASHASAESAIAAVKANVTDYIVKPYQSSDLLLTISKALDERAQALKHQRLLSMVTQALEALSQPNAPAPISPPAAAAAPARSTEVTRAGEVELDRDKRQLIWTCQPPRSVDLTESELTILMTLMEKPNQVISCNQLGGALGYQHMDKWTVENVIRSVVFRLRQKIEADSEQPRLIHTVRGRGYYFATM